ncbi:MAG: hypothetical protein ACYCUL_01835 [Metallibacterium scheffleri]
MTQDRMRITQLQKKAAKHYELVHGRLGECYAAFMLFKEIEELRQKSPVLIQPNVRYGNFWREVHFCALSKVIIDIGALVDDRDNSASLPSLYKLCVNLRKTHCVDAKSRIDSVRETWNRYRSKLIAHTDHNRKSLIEEFGRQGFTVDRFKSEIDQLTYAFTVFYAVLGGIEFPPFEDAMRFEAGFVATGERVRQDTKAFLDAIDPHLPKFESAPV